MYITQRALWVVILVSSLLGCTEEARKRLEPTPIAVGSLNQLAVIADESMWKGPVGDSLDFYFASAYPILPQPEPLFDLKHFSPAMLSEESTRKELKVYLLLSDLSNDDSPTTQMVKQDLGSEKVRRAREDGSFCTSIGRDRWAKDQLLIYLFTFGEDKLMTEVVDRFPSIAKAVQDHYYDQIDATTYLGGTNAGAVNTIQETIGCYLNVPAGYRVNAQEENLVWLMHQTDLASSNLLLHRLPYESQDQFNKENIVALRNELGKIVTSSLDNTYMRTNTEDLPTILQSTQLDDAFAVEMRGIWEMEGDFLAGPYISYLVHDQANDQLVFAEGFVLAPGEKKRNRMLYLKHILQSLSLTKRTN